MKYLLMLLTIIVLFLLFSLPEEAVVNVYPEEPQRIIFFAVGDIMLDRGVEYMTEGDFKFPFLKIKDCLHKADLLFGNLESVISDKGENVGSIYSFRAEPEAIEGLVFAGFDIISAANNHAFDYGRTALEDSLKRLKEAGIEYVGAGFSEDEVKSGILIEIKEAKIGFLAYTDQGSEYWEAKGDSSGIGWIRESIKEDIQNMESDLIFVSFHFGEEYQKEPSEKQEYFAKLAIDSGADLVIGHHPHVTQPVVKYKNGWIAYSLGNFVFDQYFSEETMTGLILEVLIEDKEIKKVDSKEFKMTEFYQPVVF